MLETVIGGILSYYRSQMGTGFLPNVKDVREGNLDPLNEPSSSMPLITVSTAAVDFSLPRINQIRLDGTPVSVWIYISGGIDLAAAHAALMANLLDANGKGLLACIASKQGFDMGNGQMAIVRPKKRARIAHGKGNAGYMYAANVTLEITTEAVYSLA